MISGRMIAPKLYKVISNSSPKVESKVHYGKPKNQNTIGKVRGTIVLLRSPAYHIRSSSLTVSQLSPGSGFSDNTLPSGWGQMPFYYRPETTLFNCFITDTQDPKALCLVVSRISIAFSILSTLYGFWNSCLDVICLPLSPPLGCNPCPSVAGATSHNPLHTPGTQKTNKNSL